MNELLVIFFNIIHRDLKIAARNLQEIINPIVFFILVVTLFPLAITPNLILLQKISPGIIWVAALLASLLALDRLFRSDFNDGTLEQMLLSPFPLSLLIFAKTWAHWLVSGLPLLLISPLLGLMFHLPLGSIVVLMISLLLGTPILSFLGSIILALTVGLPNGSILLSLLLLPLYIPVLIFGAGTVSTALNHLPINGDIAMLAAICMLSLTISPFVTAGALRIGLSL